MARPTKSLLPPQKNAPRSNALTRQRLAEDMAAFQKAGGRIEVLGNTRSLKKIGDSAADAQSAGSAVAAKK